MGGKGVGYLGDAYEKWVHRPIISNKGPRFFEFGFWRWHTSYRCLQRHAIRVTSGFLGQTLHTTSCMVVHQKHPMNGLQLVFTPVATAVLCIPAYNLLRLISTPKTTTALFGGVLLGYATYDCTHYYLHHGQPAIGMPQKLKKEPPEPSLPDAEQRVRGHLIVVGHRVRDSSVEEKKKR